MIAPFRGAGVVFRRELAAVARQRFAFPARTVGLILLLVALAALWGDRMQRQPRGGMTSSELGAIGRDLMFYCSFALDLLVVLLMPAVVGGAVAGEREEHRHDVLRMMPIGSFSIVFAKLAARLAYAFQWILLGGPFFLIPLSFGGVSAGDAAVAILFPMGAAVWTATAALIVSSFTTRTITAILAAYLIIVAYNVLGTFLLDGICHVGLGFIQMVPLAGYLFVPLRYFEMNANAIAASLLWLLPLETLAFLALGLVVAAWRWGREPGGRALAAAREAIGPARRRIWNDPIRWKACVVEAGSGPRRLIGAGLSVYVACLCLYGATERWGMSTSMLAAAGLVTGVLGIAGAARPRWRGFCWTMSALAGLFGGVYVLILWMSTGLAAAILIAALAAIAAIGRVRHESSKPFVAAGLAWLLPLAFLPFDGYIKRPFLGDWQTFVAILAAYLVLAAALSASTAIVGERVAGTYECLRLAPVAHRRLVGGKAWGCWAALGPALGVLAIEGVILGVCFDFRLGDLVLLAAILLSWLTLTIEFGLWVSARCRQITRAVLIVTAAQITYLVALPIAALLGGPTTARIIYTNTVWWFLTVLERRGEVAFFHFSITWKIEGAVMFCIVALAAAIVVRHFTWRAIRRG